MRHLIFGPGYLGLRVAKLWHAAGDHVTLVSRKVQQVEAFNAARCTSIGADITKPNSLRGLPNANVVLFAVGRERHSNQTPHQVYTEGFGNVLEALRELDQPKIRIILISTTGVYPDSGGDWMTESTAAAPMRASAKALFEAEQRLRASCFAKNSVILRLAGIYGPGRIPRMKRIAPSKPRQIHLQAASNQWLNLIHVDDAANAVVAAASALPGVYNVSDGHPVQRSDFLSLVQKLFPVDCANASDGLQANQESERKRNPANKRISNKSMRTHLGITLQFPSYREGLMSIANSDSPKVQESKCKAAKEC